MIKNVKPQFRIQIFSSSGMWFDTKRFRLKRKDKYSRTNVEKENETNKLLLVKLKFGETIKRTYKNETELLKKNQAQRHFVESRVHITERHFVL